MRQEVKPIDPEKISELAPYKPNGANPSVTRLCSAFIGKPANATEAGFQRQMEETMKRLGIETPFHVLIMQDFAPEPCRLQNTYSQSLILVEPGEAGKKDQKYFRYSSPMDRYVEKPLERLPVIAMAHISMGGNGKNIFNILMETQSNVVGMAGRIIGTRTKKSTGGMLSQLQKKRQAVLPENIKQIHARWKGRNWTMPMFAAARLISIATDAEFYSTHPMHAATLWQKEFPRASAEMIYRNALVKFAKAIGHSVAEVPATEHLGIDEEEIIRGFGAPYSHYLRQGLRYGKIMQLIPKSV